MILRLTKADFLEVARANDPNHTWKNLRKEVKFLTIYYDGTIHLENDRKNKIDMVPNIDHECAQLREMAEALGKKHVEDEW